MARNSSLKLPKKEYQQLERRNLKCPIRANLAILQLILRITWSTCRIRNWSTSQCRRNKTNNNKFWIIKKWLCLCQSSSGHHWNHTLVHLQWVGAVEGLEPQHPGKQLLLCSIAIITFRRATMTVSSSVLSDMANSSHNNYHYQHSLQSCSTRASNSNVAATITIEAQARWLPLPSHQWSMCKRHTAKLQWAKICQIAPRLDSSSNQGLWDLHLQFAFNST